MKILGLPGINPVTGPWLQSLIDIMDLEQPDSTVQHYQCWFTPGSGLDLEFEADLAGQADPDLVIAKSIGTRVALFSYTRNLLSADRYVFIGTPLKGYSDKEIELLGRFCASVPVLLIQQTGDKAGSYSSLVSLIPAAATCRIAEVPGSDHVYSDINLLKEIIETWYGQSVM